MKRANAFLEAAEKIQREPSPGPKLEHWVKEAGFRNVVHRRFRFPVGPWPKDAHMKDVGLCTLIADDVHAGQPGPLWPDYLGYELLRSHNLDRASWRIRPWIVGQDLEGARNVLDITLRFNPRVDVLAVSGMEIPWHIVDNDRLEEPGATCYPVERILTLENSFGIGGQYGRAMVERTRQAAFRSSCDELAHKSRVLSTIEDRYFCVYWRCPCRCLSGVAGCVR